jgi:dolichol-phosphate mannosyltransferase
VPLEKSSLLSDSLVIIPTYNEKENIAKMVETVFGLSHDFHLLIVDDGSPDGTGNIIKELQRDNPDRLHLLERAGKLGLGTAYLDGFRWGLKRPENTAISLKWTLTSAITPRT